MTPLTLTVVPGQYSVAHMPSDSTIPGWVQQGEFWSVSHTRFELSLVCQSQFVPFDVTAEPDWTLLRLEGPFEFSLVGILTSVLDPLRDAGVSILAISTHDTDYVLVKEIQFTTALQALETSGHQIRSEN